MNATVFDTYQKDIMSKLQPETCFGHVPFQAGRHAVEETMRAGHDAVERWLLTASPFVYPYGRGRHGDFDELSADEERTMLPQWTAVIVLRVQSVDSDPFPSCLERGDRESHLHWQCVLEEVQVKDKKTLASWLRYRLGWDSPETLN